MNSNTQGDASSRGSRPPDGLPRVAGADGTAHMQNTWSEWRNTSRPRQQQSGYVHTLAEISQQPATWTRTARDLTELSGLTELLASADEIVLSGSGSSLYAGVCAAPPLRSELRIPVWTIPGASVLTDGAQALPFGKSSLFLSLARSGDSPESFASIERILSLRPDIRHLILTTNPNGRIATGFSSDDRVRVVALDERTCDRSLVMTSSFSNLALAARALSRLNEPDELLAIAQTLSAMASRILEHHADRLSVLGQSNFRRVCFLGTSARFGAAQECALKMLEMTAGRVATLCETYLGLRHGPMTFVDAETVVVCFLSTDATRRAYELDLIRELDRKQLGCARVVAGESLPPDVAGANGLAIDYSANGVDTPRAGDDNLPIVDVVVGQLLAFSRCMAEGLRPDSPSEDSVISRVVADFQIHTSTGVA